MRIIRSKHTVLFLRCLGAGQESSPWKSGNESIHFFHRFFVSDVGVKKTWPYGDSGVETWNGLSWRYGEQLTASDFLFVPVVIDDGNSSEGVNGCDWCISCTVSFLSVSGIEPVDPNDGLCLTRARPGPTGVRNLLVVPGVTFVCDFAGVSGAIKVVCGGKGDADVADCCLP